MRIQYLDRRFEPLTREASSGHQGVPSFAPGFLLGPYLLEGLGLGEWPGIVGLALAGVAFAVVAFNVLRSRQGRIAKAFLLDSAGTPLKELVFDPRCPITLSEAQDSLPGRGLSDEAETKTSGYRLVSLHAENLRLILAFRGRVPLEGPSFAKFPMVSVQGRFDEAFVTRAAQVEQREATATQREAALREGEERLAPQQEAIEKETAILNERARKLSEQKEYFDGRMAGVRLLGQQFQTSASEVSLERDRLQNWVGELGTREERVHQLESDSDRRLANLKKRKSRLVGREQKVKERERKAAASGVTSRTIAEDAGAKLLDVRKREENLAVREQGVAHGRTQLDRALAELAQRTETFRATEATRTAAAVETRRQFDTEVSDFQRNRDREVARLEERKASLDAAERQRERAGQEIERRQREGENREQALAAREAAVRAEEQKVSRTQAQIQERETLVTARGVELYSASRDLTTHEAKLKDRVAELARFEEAQKMKGEEITRRLAGLAAKEEEARKERAVIDRERAQLQALQAESSAAKAALHQKEADLGAKEKRLSGGTEEVTNLRSSLVGKEDALAQRMRELDARDAELRSLGIRLDARAREFEQSSASTDATRAAADKAARDVEQRQREIDQHIKFLQTRAVEAIEKEERLRAHENAIKEREDVLDARAEILDMKDRQLESDRGEIEREWRKLLQELERLFGEKLVLGQKTTAVDASDIKAWREDIGRQLRVLQRHASDLLDREEKIRQREDELRKEEESLKTLKATLKPSQH